MKRLLFSIYTSLLVRFQNQIVGMKFFNFVLVSVVFSALIFSSCNEPSILGAELVEDDLGEIQIVDTFQLSMETMEGAPVIGFNPITVNFPNYLLGDFKDPIFGNSEASVYFRIASPGFFPDFDQITSADSIVMVLPYDTATFYGNTNQNFTFDLLEITGNLDPTFTYNTDTSIATNPIPLEPNISFIPNGVDSLDIIVSDTDDQEDSIRVAPQLRIKLAQSYLQRLITTDSLTYESDSLFLDLFRGFHLVPTSSQNGMLSVDMEDPAAGIFLYYHTSDSTFENFQFPFNRVIVPSYNQTTADSPVEDFINDQANADSIFFVQGMRGLSVKIELPDLSSLGNVIINRAEIELTNTNIPDDDITLYPATDQLTLTHSPNGDSTERIAIDDLAFAGTGIDDIRELFGGNLVTGSSGDVQSYTMLIGAHLQRVLDGELDNVLFLQPNLRSQIMSRAAFKGPSATENPARLKILYTEIQ